MTNQEIEKMLQEYYSDKRILSLKFEFQEGGFTDVFLYEIETNSPLMVLNAHLEQKLFTFEKKGDNYAFKFITDRKKMIESFENIKDSKALYK